MPGNYTLRETYVDGDVLSAADYVADHQQHIDNQTPIGTDDYSANVTQMRTITSPGDVGSESLPTSLAGEIERLRFTIKQIKDLMNGSSVAQWYTTSFNLTLADGLVTAAKLADGATHIQSITTTSATYNWTNLLSTGVSQAFTNARSFVRVYARIHASVECLVPGGGTGVLSWRVTRDGTPVFTAQSIAVNYPTGIPAGTRTGFGDSILLVLATTPGAHTWIVETAQGNNNVEVLGRATLTLEEVA